MSVAERVRELVDPVLTDAGLELVDVELVGATLRVSVDGPTGIDLDGITEATRLVSAALDRADPLPGRYVLEVSSPGVERRLRTPEHFHRFVGGRVAVKLRAGGEGAEGVRRIEGVLSDADDAGIVVDGRRLAYPDIERARTVFEWPEKRGKPKQKTGRARGDRAWR